MFDASEFEGHEASTEFGIVPLRRCGEAIRSSDVRSRSDVEGYIMNVKATKSW